MNDEARQRVDGAPWRWSILWNWPVAKRKVMRPGALVGRLSYKWCTRADRERGHVVKCPFRPAFSGLHKHFHNMTPSGSGVTTPQPASHVLDTCYLELGISEKGRARRARQAAEWQPRLGNSPTPTAASTHRQANGLLRFLSLCSSRAPRAPDYTSVCPAGA